MCSGKGVETRLSKECVCEEVKLICMNSYKNSRCRDAMWGRTFGVRPQTSFKTKSESGQLCTSNIEHSTIHTLREK